MPEDFGDISIDSEKDYDSDGLLDVTEINFEAKDINGNNLITFDAENNAVLPNFNKCVETGGTYVEDGLKRFYEKADDSVFALLNKTKVLPLNSDPTSTDGDCDGMTDNTEYDSETSALKTNTLIGYKNLFTTTIGKIVFDSENESKINKAYSLANKYKIINQVNANYKQYGVIGDKNDAYYLEAYSYFNTNKKTVENFLTINVNAKFNDSKLLATDKTITDDEIMKKIANKWSISDKSKNNFDFYKGMNIKVNVVFNKLTTTEKGAKKVYYDYLNNNTVQGKVYPNAYVQFNLYDMNNTQSSNKYGFEK